ncbi:MAG TPA: ABC transporter permease [Thermodesulfobacteriota bacterium]|nr:ABC transporter permease [Thermodesulfobacteriota bacterium]
MPTVAEPRAKRPESFIVRRLSGFSIRYSIFLFFGLFFAVVAFLRPNFISLGNIYDILIEASLVIFVAFGEAIVIAAGAVDLSLGNIAGSGAMIACALLSVREFSVPAGLSIGIGAGVLIGLINGVFVTRLYMNSLIATLGTMFMLIGLLYMVTFGQTIMLLPDAFTMLGTGSILKIPIPIIIMAFVFLICHLLMEKTKYGRTIQLIGGNIEASRLSGINIKNVILFAFVACGLLATLSGILLAARQGLANVDLGERFLLQAFTAAMLGTVIFGGRNVIVGTFFGSIFLISLINGMTILGVGPEWIYFAQGSLLLGAILLNYYSKRVLPGLYR